jgi:hypothetical protein
VINNFESVPNDADTSVWLMNGRGYPLADVPVDFNNATRSTTLADGSVDIGAYEVTPTVAPPLAFASGAPEAGTTTSYTWGQDTVAYITWTPSSSVPSAIEMRYYPGTNPPSPTSGSNYMNAYWDISTSTASVFDYALKLKYNPATLGTVPSENDLVIAKYDGTWNPFTGTATITNTAQTSMEITNQYSFSQFTGTDNNLPLPVTLGSFAVILRGSEVSVQWQTASEKNVSHFVVERSFDNHNFTTVGNVPAKGTSSTPVAYEFTDREGVELCRSIS